MTQVSGAFTSVMVVALLWLICVSSGGVQTYAQEKKQALQIADQVIF